MLDALLEESVELLEEDFFKKDFRFSYSSLSKLLFSPAIFYQMYVLGHKEDKMTSNMLEGKVIHCLLLEENHFDKYFIVSPTTLPSTQLKSLVERVYYLKKFIIEETSSAKFEDFETEILESMQAMNYYQALKDDKGRLSKVLTPETKSYFDFLKTKGSRDIIDNDTLKYCVDAVEIIKMTPGVLELLGFQSSEFPFEERNIEVYNESYTEFNIDGYPFGFKGIIDNLKVDHDKKTIYINDFKTSGKALKDFPESVEYFSYWLQAVMYILSVSHEYEELLESGYELKFHFIVIDRYFNVYSFPVSDATRDKWLTRFVEEVLPVVKYHYENNRFELPYEFDKGLVVL